MKIRVYKSVSRVYLGEIEQDKPPHEDEWIIVEGVQYRVTAVTLIQNYEGTRSEVVVA